MSLICTKGKLLFKLAYDTPECIVTLLRKPKELITRNNDIIWYNVAELCKYSNIFDIDYSKSAFTNWRQIFEEEVVFLEEINGFIIKFNTMYRYYLSDIIEFLMWLSTWTVYGEVSLYTTIDKLEHKVEVTSTSFKLIR